MVEEHTPSSGLGRRSFLKKSAIGAGIMTLPSFVVGQVPTVLSPNNRLNLALVGVAGKAKTHCVSALAENVVALCDVDMGHVNNERYYDGPSEGKQKQSSQFNEALTTFEKKGARWFTDYRVMLDEMGDKIDAVVITTPDHMHFPIAMSAINRGKHVYVEKPMAHTVEEAQLMREAAEKAGVVTQMGNQGHSNGGARLVKEWIAAGVIGEVREVHSWTNRPAAYWEQGLPRPDHSAGAPPVPEGLDWKLWLGVAEERAYDPAYMPFDWRAYTDFGCGALGDMGCHIMDAAIWGLDLGYPLEVSAATSAMNGYTYPKQTAVTYTFPSRGAFPELTYHWYSGGLYPPIPAFMKETDPFRGDSIQTNGTLIVGEGAALLIDTYSSSVRMLPREKFIEARSSLPPKTLRRIKGDHFTEWTNAIRENRKATSDFSYAGPMTETVLIGAAAIRAGRPLKFDASSRMFVGDDEANRFLKKDYPDGWILS
ncbi:MAG: Gfo/Idh/MocA family protein [Puniceicoccaceae bacterium]